MVSPNVTDLFRSLQVKHVFLIISSYPVPQWKMHVWFILHCSTFREEREDKFPQGFSFICDLVSFFFLELNEVINQPLLLFVITDAGSGCFTFVVLGVFAISGLSVCHGQFTWKRRIVHIQISNNKINCPWESNKASSPASLKYPSSHGKQMGFALCLEGHQPWALQDQQRKYLLLKIPSCLSPQQTWQKWLLNPGTSFLLVLDVTARLILSKALAKAI